MRAVTVYCSSSTALEPHFAAAAQRVGRELASRGIALVYGGGGVGLMGEVARAARGSGGRVEGIITSQFVTLEQAWDGCDEMVVVDTMRERKRLLEERGDAFLILPGGLGTYEEFFEILVGRYLGHHGKPIGVVNDHGYYDPLVALIEHGIEHKFIRPAIRDLLHVRGDAIEVVDLLVQAATRADARTAAALSDFLPSGPRVA